MKKHILAIALGTLILISCKNNKPFVTGSWTIENMNSVDSSVNVETLLATAFAKYPSAKILILKSDNTLTLTTADGKVLDQGTFKSTDNDSCLSIKFANDKIEGKYKISNETLKSVKLKATDNGETINMTLIKNEK